MKKKVFRSLFYLFISVLSLNPLFSQPIFYENGSQSHPNVLGYSSATRSIIDLAGEWDFSIDNGITWKQVHIPAAADYEGKIVFRKKFGAGSESIAKNAFRFVAYGINYISEVYINDIFIGRHEGGYTSFELPVPENVIQIGEENVIRVVVDNTLNYRSTFPLRAQVNGWKNYCGITRDIFIVASSQVWIDHVGVTVEAIEPKATRLLVTTLVSAKELRQIPELFAKTMQIAVDVSETNSGFVVGKTTAVPIRPESNNQISVQTIVTIPTAKLWSPESPELYTLKVSLIGTEAKKDSLLDETSIVSGIRTFTRDKNVLLFNGAPVTLRGVTWIEDTDLHGSAVSYEEMERDVALIKNLGANTVRVGFNPPHPYFLYMCDRYGLFVLEEIPNVEMPGRLSDQEPYRELMVQRLKEMIERDKHHPSVIAWGLGDAAEKSSGQNSVMQMLQRTAVSMDSRLTYSTTVDGGSSDVAVTDIAAVSLMNTELRSFRSSLMEFKRVNGKHPVIVVAYGKQAETGNRNGYSDPYSQEAQARHLQQRYAVIKDLNVAGSIIFSFNDFRSDRPILSVRSRAFDIHTTGIVELERQKKVAYDNLHSLYHDQKLSALPMGTYVAPSPYIYVVIGLMLLIVAAWLVNGNRRYRESTRRAIFNSYNFFADIRDQFTLPLFHTTITAFILSVTVGVIASSLLYNFRSSIVLDYLLSYFFSDAFKRIIIQMAWDPLLSVGYSTAVMLVWFVVVTLAIQLCSKIARVKVRLFHSYSIAVWTALPWAIFIPIGMILYRVLQSDPYVPWIIGLIGFMAVWIFFRTLKGISVIYHVYTPKMYMIGIISTIVIFGALFVYYDYMHSLTAYAEYFVSSILPFAH